MNCSRVNELLLEYLDDRLESPSRNEVETHLAQCASCRSLVEEHRLTWKLLDHYPGLSGDASKEADQVAALVSQAKAQDYRWPSRTRAWLPFLVAAAVLCGVFLWLRDGADSQDPLTPSSVSDSEVIANLDLLLDMDLIDEFSAELDVRQELELLDILSEEESGR